MKHIFTLVIMLSVIFESGMAQSVPNIVVILTDDLGYADVSFNPEHSEEISTPHIDSLAKEGVVFSQAYTTSALCSPTRAGLMLGSYQQRHGINGSTQGDVYIDPTIPIFPAYLPGNYKSSSIGKWHLGSDDDYPELRWNPVNLGFDNCFVFMGAGHDYFNDKRLKGDLNEPIYRDTLKIPKSEYGTYLTTRFTMEAIDFIEKEKSNPFFLYLAYSAVHTPAQAPKKDIEFFRKKYPHLKEQRIILLAMLYHLDIGVGAIVNKLKEENLWDNTIFFFLTDNGGAQVMSSDNGKLRGYKGSLYEGGIRTPFIVSWPAEFEGGKTVDAPIMSFDILPTVLSAVGVEYDTSKFDGKNILPLICEGEESIHSELYWDEGKSRRLNTWAIRKNNFKAISRNDIIEIYNLNEDPYEKINLAKFYPKYVDQFNLKYIRWSVKLKE